MATIKATCLCRASFESEGSDIQCGLELSKFLKAHEKCRKNNKAIHTDGESAAVCGLCGYDEHPGINCSDYQ